MSWITIVWSMNAGACFVLAGVCFVVWCKQRESWPHLLFACSAVAAACIALIELAMLRGKTVGQYAELIRWIHEWLRRSPCDVRYSSLPQYRVADLHPSEATSSRIQLKEEKALSLIFRPRSRRSNHPVGIRETPRSQPISSGRSRLAIHMDWQCAYLEFANSTRDRLPLADLVSQFDSSLSL